MSEHIDEAEPAGETVGDLKDSLLHQLGIERPTPGTEEPTLGEFLGELEQNVTALASDHERLQAEHDEDLRAVADAAVQPYLAQQFDALREREQLEQEEDLQHAMAMLDEGEHGDISRAADQLLRTSPELFTEFFNVWSAEDPTAAKEYVILNETLHQMEAARARDADAAMAHVHAANQQAAARAAAEEAARVRQEGLTSAIADARKKHRDFDDHSEIMQILAQEAGTAMTLATTEDPAAAIEVLLKSARAMVQQKETFDLKRAFVETMRDKGKLDYEHAERYQPSIPLPDAAALMPSPTAAHIEQKKNDLRAAFREATGQNLEAATREEQIRNHRSSERYRNEEAKRRQEANAARWTGGSPPIIADEEPPVSPFHRAR